MSMTCIVPHYWFISYWFLWLCVVTYNFSTLFNISFIFLASFPHSTFLFFSFQNTYFTFSFLICSFPLHSLSLIYFFFFIHFITSSNLPCSLLLRMVQGSVQSYDTQAGSSSNPSYTFPCLSHSNLSFRLDEDEISVTIGTMRYTTPRYTTPHHTTPHTISSSKITILICSLNLLTFLTNFHFTINDSRLYYFIALRSILCNSHYDFFNQLLELMTYIIVSNLWNKRLFRSNLLALFVQSHDPRKFSAEKNLNYQQINQNNSRRENKTDNTYDDVKLIVEAKTNGIDIDDNSMLGSERLRSLILDLRWVN